MKTNELMGLIAMEECNEVAFEISKGIRFGFDTHTFLTSKGHMNTYNHGRDCMLEFYQLQAMIELMQKEGILPRLPDREIKQIKEDKLRKVFDQMKFHNNSNNDE